MKCPSGLRSTPGKCVYKKLYREFESLLHRHILLKGPVFTGLFCFYLFCSPICSPIRFFEIFFVFRFTALGRSRWRICGFLFCSGRHPCCRSMILSLCELSVGRVPYPGIKSSCGCSWLLLFVGQAVAQCNDGIHLLHLPQPLFHL